MRSRKMGQGARTAVQTTVQGWGARRACRTRATPRKQRAPPALAPPMVWPSLRTYVSQADGGLESTPTEVGMAKAEMVGRMGVTQTSSRRPLLQSLPPPPPPQTPPPHTARDGEAGGVLLNTPNPPSAVSPNWTTLPGPPLSLGIAPSARSTVLDARSPIQVIIN